LSYQHGGLDDGRVYYYKVAAVNAIGEATNSSIISAKTWSVPEKPVISITVESSPTGLTVKISWMAVPFADSYLVYRNVHPFTTGAGDSALIISNTTATTVINQVPEAGRYWYVVVAVNASGHSEPSTSVSIVVVAPPGQDWVIIIIIGVGIAAIIGVASPYLKRKVRISRNLSGKSGKKKGYVDLPGKKNTTSHYSELNNSLLPPSPLESIKKHPSNTVISGETKPFRPMKGMMTLFEPEVFNAINKLGIKESVVDDLLELLQDLPPGTRAKYIEDMFQDTQVDESDDV